MVNTHGWMASDEMFYYTQSLMWSGSDMKFSPPVLWDITKQDFDEAGHGEPNFYNNSTTVLPILVRSHWGAVEITKRGDQTSITFIQIHADFRDRLTMILARFLDIAPHRIQIHMLPEYYRPHLCGWHLMMRWYSWGGHHQTIADLTDQLPLPPNVSDLVDDVLRSSREDWQEESIDRGVGELAFRLRKNFVLILAHSHVQGRPHTQVALHVEHPPPPVVRTVQVATEPTLTREQRIQQRLAHFQQFRGWLATDEMDYTLEGPRALSTNTLFCAPAVWNTQTGNLAFLNDLVPEYAAFGHVIWHIVVNNHWIAVEAYFSTAGANFGATVPVDMRELLRPLFDHLVHITEVDRSTLQFTFLDQVAPTHMCGYHLLRQLFRRLEADQIALNPTQTLQLQSSKMKLPSCGNKHRPRMPCAPLQMPLAIGSSSGFLRIAFQIAMLLQGCMTVMSPCLRTTTSVPKVPRARQLPKGQARMPMIHGLHGTRGRPRLPSHSNPNGKISSFELPRPSLALTRNHCCKLTVCSSLPPGAELF